MIYAFLTGFILGFSLILAIGAQNSFVLRQGLIGRHVFIVALFCALSDALLIIIGVAGISIFLNYIDLVSDWLFGISAIWLAGYGLLRLRDAVTGKSALIAENSSANGLAFILGASIASFVFFFSLSYGAKLLAPIMKRPSAWRILDGSIALLMFIIAVKLAYSGNWL